MANTDDRLPQTASPHSTDRGKNIVDGFIDEMELLINRYRSKLSAEEKKEILEDIRKRFLSFEKKL